VLSHANCLDIYDVISKVNNMLKKTLLAAEAYAYIKDNMSYGYTLESYLNHIDLTRGHVTTYPPDYIDPTTMTNFHDDIFYKGDAFTSEALVEDDVIQYLRGGENRYGIFEDAITRKHSLFAFTYNEQTMYHQDELYYMVQRTNDDETIRGNMEAAVNFRAVGVCFQAEHPLPIVHGQEIPEAWFSMAATNVAMLLIGAFDEGGWLVWTPFPSRVSLL